MASKAETVSSKIVVRSAEGEEFELEYTIAVHCEMLKKIIESECTSTVVPLPNVTSPVLAKVIAYCKHCAEKASPAAEDAEGKSVLAATKYDPFDEEMVVADKDMLFELLSVANYLDCKSLFNLACSTVANKIKDMTVEQVRTYFNIENDFTPEEEAKIREGNSWAYDSSLHL